MLATAPAAYIRYLSKGPTGSTMWAVAECISTRIFIGTYLPLKVNYLRILSRMWLPKHIFGSALIAGMLSQVPVGATPSKYRELFRPTTTLRRDAACVDGETIEKLWLLKDLNVTFGGEGLLDPGNATWTLTNTLTNVTESFDCSLLANYRCDIHGTPKDSSLQIWIQINLNIADVSLNQSLPCGNLSTELYVDIALFTAVGFHTPGLGLRSDAS